MSDVKTAAQRHAVNWTTPRLSDEAVAALAHSFEIGAAWQRERDAKICSDTYQHYEREEDLGAARGAGQCGQSIKATAIGEDSGDE